MPPDTQAPRGFERELGPGGLETRNLPIAHAEIRAAKDGKKRQLVGYGSVFDTPFRMGTWEEWDEEVASGAFTDAIKDDADIRSMRNHDTNYLLGRTTNGSLRVEEDDTGLRYEVDINEDDPSAMATYAQVERGDIDGSSIWFRVEEQKWTYPTKDNGLEVPKRTILKINPLFEVGCVVFPANEAAGVGVGRSSELVDAMLRSAGVTGDIERAELANRLLSDPASAEQELRSLFDRAPQLRAAVCGCDTDPEGAGRLADPDDVRAEVERRQRVARGLAARTGLPTITQE